MDELTLTIDGHQVTVAADVTILEAARLAGVEIPALCYDPRLEPFTSCWLCVVEVEGARGPVPACTARVGEGMVVRTRTEQITGLRRLSLELLLSAHYGDCIAPCQQACPAGIDIQGFIALIADGQYDEALKLIKETNPFPAVCGRVCPRFCEEACRRNLIGEPVAINWLKRFVADIDLASDDGYVPPRAPATGKKVAVVGAGPAGLSCAFFLARKGHQVTVFESKPEPGGMLRYGIPAYRLPRDVLRSEIDRILALGIDLRCNTRWGRDFTMATLREKGFNAAFVGIGAGVSHSLNLPGEDLPGIQGGVEFLERVAAGEQMELGDRVVVIGGGNTAIDAARTARRLGARDVTILYRRSRVEMPAHEEEVADAESEGVKLALLATPIRFLGNGRVESAECIRMQLGEPDATGRRRPEPVEGSEFTVPADTVVLAVGQHMDEEPARNEPGIPLTRYGYIRVSEDTWQVADSACFAGGDCASGAATVVEAIGAGRRAAESIDRHLRGEELSLPQPVVVSKGELDEIDPAEYADEPLKPRQPNPKLPVEERVTSFAAVELGFDEEAALREADRCLACGCVEFHQCTLQKLATEYQARPQRFRGAMPREPLDTRHPLFIRDPSKCILCGRCVRACIELAGVGALGFVGRGFEARVEPEFGLPLSMTGCTDCGLCVGACPTGALTAMMPLPKPGRWDTVPTLTTCGYCGVGCTVELQRKGRRLIRATAPFEAPVNQGSLCARGLFGWQRAHCEGRIRAPMVASAGRQWETTWDDALQAAADGLRRTLRDGGPEEIAVLIAPWWPNEAMWLTRRFAGEVLGTSNVLAVAPSVLSDAAVGFRSDGLYDDLDGAGTVVLVGVELTRKYPVLAVRLRQAVRDGVAMATVGRETTGVEDISAAGYRPRSGGACNALLELLEGKRRTPGARAVKELCSGSAGKLVVADLDLATAEEVEALEELRRRFPGEVKVLGLRGEANAQGAAELNLRPGSGTQDLLARCIQGEVKALVLFGLASSDVGPLIELRERPAFLVVADAVESPLSTAADVVLPAPLWMEEEGTVLNPEGRLQQLVPALVPPGGLPSWEMVVRLAAAMGAGWTVESVDAAFSELVRGKGWELDEYQCEGLTGAVLGNRAPTAAEG